MRRQRQVSPVKKAPKVTPRSAEVTPKVAEEARVAAQGSQLPQDEDLRSGRRSAVHQRFHQRVRIVDLATKRHQRSLALL